MTWSFSWETGWSSLWTDQFLERWTAAFEPGSQARVSPFVHPIVVRAWAETIGIRERDTMVLHARHTDGREVVQIMVRSKQHFPGQISKVLMPFGGDRFDFTEPLIFAGEDGSNLLKEDFWEALERDLKPRQGKLFDQIVFPRLRDDTLGGYVPPGEADVAPYIDLEPYSTIDEYLETRNGKRRRSLRRRLKKIEEAGDFSFQVLQPSELERILAWVPMIMREKRRKFPHDTGMDQLEAFLTNLVREAAPKKLVRCSCCTLDGKDISWNIDFVLGDEILQYVSDFDPEFREYGLGNIHTYHQIEWAISRGIRYFNFLWGAEEYKTDWTNGEVQALYPIRINSSRPMSRLRVFADRVARRLVKA